MNRCVQVSVLIRKVGKVGKAGGSRARISYRFLFLPPFLPFFPYLLSSFSLFSFPQSLELYQIPSSTPQEQRGNTLNGRRGDSWKGKWKPPRRTSQAETETWGMEG